MNKNNKIILASIVTLGIFTSGCSTQSGDEMSDTSLGGISESFFGSPRYTSDGTDSSNDNSGSSYSNQATSTPQRSSGMDRVDDLNLNNALNNPSDNKATTWVNPSTNKRYTVTPKSTMNTSGDYCRTYTMNTIIDGQSQTVTGRACRVNGKWVKQ